MLEAEWQCSISHCSTISWAPVSSGSWWPPSWISTVHMSSAQNMLRLENNDCCHKKMAALTVNCYVFPRAAQLPGHCGGKITEPKTGTSSEAWSCPRILHCSVVVPSYLQLGVFEVAQAWAESMHLHKWMLWTSWWTPWSSNWSACNLFYLHDDEGCVSWIIQQDFIHSHLPKWLHGREHTKSHISTVVQNRFKAVLVGCSTFEHTQLCICSRWCQ